MKPKITVKQTKLLIKAQKVEFIYKICIIENNKYYIRIYEYLFIDLLEMRGEII